VEDLLFERGIDIGHEIVRRWPYSVDNVVWVQLAVGVPSR